MEGSLREVIANQLITNAIPPPYPEPICFLIKHMLSIVP